MDCTLHREVILEIKTKAQLISFVDILILIDCYDFCHSWSPPYNVEFSMHCAVLNREIGRANPGMHRAVSQDKAECVTLLEGEFKISSKKPTMASGWATVSWISNGELRITGVSRELVVFRELRIVNMVVQQNVRCWEVQMVHKLLAT